MDLLLKFPDQDKAVQFGTAFGATSEDEESGENVTAAHVGDLNIHVIGTHYAPTGETDTDTEGNELPVMEAVPGWWIMVRAPDGFPVAGTIGQLPAEIQPEVVWAAVDENGEPVPRPTDPLIPDRVWA